MEINSIDDITIYDNFFDEKVLNKILNLFQEYKWQCNCLKNPNKNRYKDVPFWRKDLNDNSFFIEELKNIIEDKLKKKFLLQRVYAVGQTYEQNSNYHVDSNIKDTYTFCFYINNNILNENLDGFFHIKVPNKKYVLLIEPSNNRGVFFPATYIHKGTGFSRLYNNFRICIAWKLKEI